jgi:uncharacterized RDD family membrane protein YckC
MDNGMAWYYIANNTQIGPVSDEEFQALADRGEITDATYVWQPGMPEWRRRKDVAVAAPPARPPVAPQPDLRQRTIEAGHVSRAGGAAFCCECSRSFPLDDVAIFGDEVVCAECKPLYVQRLMQNGLDGLGSSGHLGVPFAGFSLRLAAKLVDGVLAYGLGALLLALLIIALFFGSDRRPPTDEQDALAGMIMLGCLVGLPLLYNAICHGLWGATIGKLAVGIRVVRADGTSLGLVLGTLRAFAELISIIVLGLGYLTVLVDDNRRALHDYICGTRVVYRR